VLGSVFNLNYSHGSLYIGNEDTSGDAWVIQLGINAECIDASHVAVDVGRFWVSEAPECRWVSL